MVRRHQAEANFAAPGQPENRYPIRLEDHVESEMRDVEVTRFGERLGRNQRIDGLQLHRFTP
jgi:hypothetical protein